MSVVYEYRVFIERGNGETDVSHFCDEKLWEGAVFRANKPGSEFLGLSVLVQRVASHPTPDGPGIAHGRLRFGRPRTDGLGPPLAARRGDLDRELVHSS